MGGVFAVLVYYSVASVFAQSVADACHPVIAISVVPGPRDNSGCLDARSLTLPLYGPGVGRSAKAEAPQPSHSQMTSGASAGGRSGGKMSVDGCGVYVCPVVHAISRFVQSSKRMSWTIPTPLIESNLTGK
jgi:hypothetical protein